MRASLLQSLSLADLATIARQAGREIMAVYTASKVDVRAKADESRRIFGSVNALQIAQALKEQYSFDIDRKKIHVDHEHIKELGTYKARISIHKDVSTEITFEVFAE